MLCNIIIVITKVLEISVQKRTFVGAYNDILDQSHNMSLQKRIEYTFENLYHDYTSVENIVLQPKKVL